MSFKKIAVDQSVWTLPDDAPETLPADIQAALTGGSVLRLDVLDDYGRRISLFVNGKNTTTVTLDLSLDDKPSEISG